MPSNLFDALAPAVLGALKESTPAYFQPKVEDLDLPDGGLPVNIVFVSRHQDIHLGVTFGEPRIAGWIAQSEMPYKPKYEDVLTINGKDYSIREIKDDGLAFYELTLVLL